MADRYTCVACSKEVTKTKNDRYRSHSDGTGEVCEMSSEPIPGHVLAQPAGKDDQPDVPREGVDYALCPQCERKVKLTRLGYFEPHDTTLRGGDRCEVSGVRFKHARRTETVPLPGDEPASPAAAKPAVRDSEINWDDVGDLKGPPPHVANLARDPMPSPESTSTSAPSEKSSDESEQKPTPDSSSESPEEPERGPFPMAPLLGDGSVLQPFSYVLQPFPAPVRLRVAESMSERGREMAARLREVFYAYNNRNTRDNRSAQTTLGPSEIGSPCDRQIAMKLLGIAPANPQEGWAPFVGTAVHVELARMFEWANGAGSGRYVTEMPLTFGSTLVPRGTGDLLDRVLCMFLDHKLMGKYSLDKLIQEGPSETYRTQVHVYGLGAEMAGEKVKEVAIVAWPRQESSLDKLYVHVEKYDRKIAQAALDRVDRLASSVQGLSLNPDNDQMDVAREFSPGDDCKWCPFHLKGDKEMRRGCPGK